MKLWLDDVRPPPDETWFWARRLNEAVDFLWFNRGCVVECSLDHDLGLHDVGVPDNKDDWDDYIDVVVALKGHSEETGYDLVDWALENEIPMPEKITIHSWNPDGAMRMAKRLASAGHEVLVQPYKPSRLPGT